MILLISDVYCSKFPVGAGLFSVQVGSHGTTTVMANG